METEYEATFPNINKEELRERLKEVGAELVKPEFLQRRVVFNLPKEVNTSKNWARVRDEGDKITMSFKIINAGKIKDQKEINLEINDFEKGVDFLKNIGCHKKAYQETRRELWKLNGIEITIDKWPFLKPFVEIEGKTEKDVRDVSKKLGFDYSEARFCSVAVLYSEEYKVSKKVINDEIPKIVFDMKNPFLGNNN